MTDLLQVLLLPLSPIYGAAMRLRARLYEAGWLKTHHVKTKVISVGNITTGGTGKTPLVEWIARAVAREGMRVCVLSRGYGRANQSNQLLVMNDGRMLAHPNEAGDEPFLLGLSLKGEASVLCNADRVEGACWAIGNLRSEVIVLDDGFQHLRLARNLNILVIDATRPWGNGRIIPAGNLREPKSAIRRADCIVITRAEQCEDIDGLKSEMLELAGERPCFTASTRISEIVSVNGEQQIESLSSLPQPIAAFCAIGNPEAFFNQLSLSGVELCLTRKFRDHYSYSQRDIDALSREALAHRARSLITTAKDAVKLGEMSFEIPCFVARIGLEIDDERAFIALLGASG